MRYFLTIWSLPGDRLLNRNVFCLFFLVFVAVFSYCVKICCCSICGVLLHICCFEPPIGSKHFILLSDYIFFILLFRFFHLLILLLIGHCCSHFVQWIFICSIVYLLFECTFYGDWILSFVRRVFFCFHIFGEPYQWEYIEWPGMLFSFILRNNFTHGKQTDDIDKNT